MTAAQYVALARGAVTPQVLANARNLGTGFVLSVHRDGRVSAAFNQRDPESVMWARCLPENTVSEDALVRALLASAVEIRSCSRLPEWRYAALLRYPLHSTVRYGNSETAARDALLDALLASPEGR